MTTFGQNLKHHGLKFNFPFKNSYFPSFSLVYFSSLQVSPSRSQAAKLRGQQADLKPASRQWEKVRITMICLTLK